MAILFILWSWLQMNLFAMRCEAGVTMCNVDSILEGISQKHFGSTELLMLKSIWALQTAVRLASLSPLIFQFGFTESCYLWNRYKSELPQARFQYRKHMETKINHSEPSPAGLEIRNWMFPKDSFSEFVNWSLPSEGQKHCYGMQYLLYVSICSRF